MKARIVAAMAYPKKMMGLPMELWMIVLISGLLTGFLVGFLTGAQVTLTVGAGVLVAGAVFGVVFLQFLRDPFVVLRLLEYGQTAPFLNKGRFPGDVKGKRYVP